MKVIMRFFGIIGLFFLYTSYNYGLHHIEKRATATPDELTRGRALSVRDANVEIYNKSESSIIVTVVEGNDRPHISTVPSKKICQLQIYSTSQIKISIQDGPLIYHYFFGPHLMQEIADRLNIKTNEITFFLTYDDAKGLRPQTGKLGGLSGVTKTGLLLKNNITADELKRARDLAIRFGMYEKR